MGSNKKVELIKLFVAVLALVAIGWSSYNYKGQLHIDSSHIGLVEGIIVLVLLLFYNKIDSLKNKIIGLEQELLEYKRKDNCSTPLDIQKMFAEGKDTEYVAKKILEQDKKNKDFKPKMSKPEEKKKIKESIKISSENVIDSFIKKKLRPLTQEDFIISKYLWTDDSKYALTDDGILLRYEGDKYKFPAYSCLFEGYWEATDVGVGIRQIAEATPISEKEANRIIEREEKPIHTRPKERDNWISC